MLIPHLPYTSEVYFAAMAQYHTDLFPARPVLLFLFLLAFAFCCRSPQSRKSGTRAIWLILALAWLWVGAAHQLGMMADLNFMAPWYGWGWIAQGGLFATLALWPGDGGFSVRRDARSVAGAATAVAGLVLYPVAVYLSGVAAGALPAAGSSPDPTAIATAGLLILFRPAGSQRLLPLVLLPLLVGWVGVAGVSGWLLDFPLSYAVPAAALLAAVLLVAAMRTGRS